MDAGAATTHSSVSTDRIHTVAEHQQQALLALGTALSRMRAEGVHADTTVQCAGGKLVQANSALLSGVSAMFASALAPNRFREGSDKEIQLEWADASLLNAALDFCCGVTTALTEANAADLLELADRLLITTLADAAEAQLSATVTADNAHVLRKLAARCSRPALERTAAALEDDAESAEPVRRLTTARRALIEEEGRLGSAVKKLQKQQSLLHKERQKLERLLTAETERAFRISCAPAAARGEPVLAAWSHRELQEIAKALGLRANLKRQELEDAIAQPTAALRTSQASPMPPPGHYDMPWSGRILDVAPCDDPGYQQQQSDVDACDWRSHRAMLTAAMGALGGAVLASTTELEAWISAHDPTFAFAQSLCTAALARGVADGAFECSEDGQRYALSERTRRTLEKQRVLGLGRDSALSATASRPTSGTAGKVKRKRKHADTGVSAAGASAASLSGAMHTAVRDAVKAQDEADADAASKHEKLVNVLDRQHELKFKNLIDALAAAKDGDMIRLLPGIHCVQENFWHIDESRNRMDSQGFRFTKSVRLVGVGPRDKVELRWNNCPEDDQDEDAKVANLIEVEQGTRVKFYNLTIGNVSPYVHQLANIGPVHEELKHPRVRQTGGAQVWFDSCQLHITNHGLHINQTSSVSLFKCTLHGGVGPAVQIDPQAREVSLIECHISGASAGGNPHGYPSTYDLFERGECGAVEILGDYYTGRQGRACVKLALHRNTIVGNFGFGVSYRTETIDKPPRGYEPDKPAGQYKFEWPADATVEMIGNKIKSNCLGLQNKKTGGRSDSVRDQNFATCDGEQIVHNTEPQYGDRYPFDDSSDSSSDDPISSDGARYEDY